MGFGVVSELLSEVSIQQQHTTMQVTWIPRGKIVKNVRNGYHVGDISALAADIKESGIAQPLEVLQLEDGNYRLITGERRLTAIDSLIASGEWNEDIPCLIKDLEDYELPLSDEAKEMYAIIRTNRFTRKMTDADLVFETREWTKIIQELKKSGHTVLQLADNSEEEDAAVSLKGKTREIVARTLKISNGQVGKIDYITAHGVQDLQDAIQDGFVNIATAYLVAGMSREAQDIFMDTYRGKKIEKQDVENYKKNLEKKQRIQKGGEKMPCAQYQNNQDEPEGTLIQHEVPSHTEQEFIISSGFVKELLLEQEGILTDYLKEKGISQDKIMAQRVMVAGLQCLLRHIQTQKGQGESLLRGE